MFVCWYTIYIEKLYWLKQKKVIFIALAVVFLVALFLSKNQTLFTNKREDGLVYNGNEKIGDLVNRDTDGDTVPDWQEALYGTSPTKKDTNDDGIPDNVEIARLSSQNIQNGELNLNGSGDPSEPNLNETDKLSRELFSTMAALNQAGTIDQNTVDTLSSSLISKIQDSAPQKVFLYSDLKISKSDTKQAAKAYNDNLTKLYTKYPIKNTVPDVLDKFIVDENTVDESVLVELDPILKQFNNILTAMSALEVPRSLALVHLDVLNKMQKVSQNISDIRMYDTDIVVAMRGITQYQANADALDVSLGNLDKMITQKLKQ